jgi:DNA-binding LacI/PurR family transcriptional regulator
MTSVRRIAEAAGVSVSTVSLVLNDKAGVSEGTRRAVLDAVRRLRADADAASATATLNAPDIEARFFESARSADRAVVVLHPPRLRSSEVFSRVLQGIQAAAARERIALRLVANPHDEADSVAQLYFTDPALRPDGVLIFGAQHDEPLIDRAHALGLPCVVLGRDAGLYPLSGIGRDEVAMGQQAAEHLIGLGHRHIAFVGGDPAYDFTHNRLIGLQRALGAVGVRLHPACTALGDGAAAVHALFGAVASAGLPQPTAILFVNDSYAAEGLPVLAARGLRIPHDLSVVSFDDTAVAREHDPPLTSVAYPFFQEGDWALRVLIDHMRQPALARVQLTFRGALVVRASTGPVEPR